MQELEKYDRYALLDDHDVVIYIGKEEEYLRSEAGLTWIGLLPETQVKTGWKYCFNSREFKRVRKSLGEERQLLLSRINQVYRNKMSMLLYGYDEYEVMTFPFQVMGMDDYRSGRAGTFGLIFMQALSEGRKRPLADMVDRTESKTKQFVYICGFLTGVRQKLEEYAMDAIDYKQLDEVEEHLDRWSAEGLV